ncbi:uncharacterized protein LOC125032411 [Penaeus chinensis]|uniref:uncharacterized protein LOC125032411 n=1 Tax=Penaeus chinensis TaxID=139456 RepID=UPI001FB5720D|nr:uncharacterized protein LOC125032411 [Penaeus chinensis]
MGKILLFALLIGGVVQNIIVAARDCVEGCSVLRLHGLSRSLLHGLAPLYFWPPEEVDLWLEVSTFSSFFFIRGSEKIHTWHEITFTSGDKPGESCVTAPTILPNKICGSQDYVYLHANRPAFWAVNCPATPCDCPEKTIEKCRNISSVSATSCENHELYALRIPLDRASTWYWWPGKTDEIRLEFPRDSYETYSLRQTENGQWHDFTVVGNGGNEDGSKNKTCTIISRSLGLVLHCSKKVDRDSDLHVKTFSAGKARTSFWAPKCPPKALTMEIAETSESAVELRPTLAARCAHHDHRLCYSPRRVAVNRT